MLLTVDIGNTNLTLAFSRARRWDRAGAWPPSTSACPMSTAYSSWACSTIPATRPADLNGICLASVVPPLTGKIVEACQRFLGMDPLVVDAGVKTGVRIRYEDPRAVGADRIVDAAAVQASYTEVRLAW